MAHHHHNRWGCRVSTDITNHQYNHWFSFNYLLRDWSLLLLRRRSFVALACRLDALDTGSLHSTLLTLLSILNTVLWNWLLSILRSILNTILNTILYSILHSILNTILVPLSSRLILVLLFLLFARHSGLFRWIHLFSWWLCWIALLLEPVSIPERVERVICTWRTWTNTSYHDDPRSICLGCEGISKDQSQLRGSEWYVVRIVVHSTNALLERQQTKSYKKLTQPFVNFSTLHSSLSIVGLCVCSPFWSLN